MSTTGDPACAAELDDEEVDDVVGDAIRHDVGHRGSRQRRTRRP